MNKLPRIVLPPLNKKCVVINNSYRNKKFCPTGSHQIQLRTNQPSCVLFASSSQTNYNPSKKKYRRNRQDDSSRKTMRRDDIPKKMLDWRRYKDGMRHHVRRKGHRQEGLELNLEQIKRIWNSFRPTKTKDEPFEEFDLVEFVKKYPNVNRALTDKVLGKNGFSSDIIDDNKTKLTDSDDINLPEPDIANTYANEAELKLQNMLDKIQKNQNEIASSNMSMPDDVKTKIQSLLDQELDAVLHLWLQVSASHNLQNSPLSSLLSNPPKLNHESSTCSNIDLTIEDAIAAIDRAATLVKKFQHLHENGIKPNYEPSTPNSTYNSDEIFYPLSPSIQSYQMIISNYFQLYIQFTTSPITNMNHHLSKNILDKFQKQSLSVLKDMMKQVLKIRRKGELMKNMRNDHDNTQNSDYKEEEDDYYDDLDMNLNHSTTIPLSESYLHVIDLHTQMLNNERIEQLDDASLRVMLNEASSLLQESEMFFHDFQSIPSSSSLFQRFPGKGNKETSPNLFQKMLLSIHPTQEMFHHVIQAYMDVSLMNTCEYSLLQATDILHRMMKRYWAYHEEFNEGIIHDHENDIMKYICKPNVEICETVLNGYENEKINVKFTKEDADKVLEILTNIEKDDGLKSGMEKDTKLNMNELRLKYEKISERCL